MLFYVFLAFSILNLEVWSLLLWKFGLGSYGRSKDSLALRGVNRQLNCVEPSKHRTSAFCDVLMTLRSTMFWSTEPRIAAPKANETLIWHSFQDQTSTAKVITPPKSMYSPVLNGICHMSGTFYEGRSEKFWYVSLAVISQHIAFYFCIFFIQVCHGSCVRFVVIYF